MTQELPKKGPKYPNEPGCDHKEHWNCHSPVSLGWEEEFFALNTLEKMEDENIDGLEIRDFIRTKLAEQKAKHRKIFVEEVDWSEWGVTDEQAGERFDEAALKVIDEV